MAAFGVSAWTALGFVLGMGAGGAAAAYFAGKSVLAGRRCPACGTSLSLWPRVPILSWFGVVPRCRHCGLATNRLRAGIEAAALLVGVIAIFAAPFPLALYLALGGWALLLALFIIWRRFG
ncbi:MAG TPA: prepilin peptidase [Allosphingosinicella sp.]|jgi:prepilin signal peptidase PulO-like enzyme (type II secretory pathway)|nr:prepilin peptidase [Allosphingosinicella sp.]